MNKDRNENPEAQDLPIEVQIALGLVTDAASEDTDDGEE